MNRRCRLVGEFPKCVLFKEAQSVTKNGDGRQGLAVSGHDRRVVTQLLLVMKRHFELIEIKPLARITGR